MHERKITTKSKIIPIAAHLKKYGRKIVTFNGSFDLLHPGHVKALEEAKSYGDILIVLLNSDCSIRKYKGPQRPLIGQRNRAIMLAALSCVDYIVLFDELNPRELLAGIKPDIHSSGSEWGKGCIGSEEVEKYGGKIVSLSRHQGFSSSILIERIISSQKEEWNKALFIDQVLEEKFLSAEIFNKINKEYIFFMLSSQAGVNMPGSGSRERRIIKNNISLKKTNEKIFIRGNNYQNKKWQDDFIKYMVVLNKIILAKSYLISAEPIDILFGREVNMKTIKFGQPMSNYRVKPNYYIKDLKGLIKIIK